jgi:hypothetical protein
MGISDLEAAESAGRVGASVVIAHSTPPNISHRIFTLGSNLERQANCQT